MNENIFIANHIRAQKREKRMEFLNKVLINCKTY